LLAYAGYKLAIDSNFSFSTDTATAVYNLEVAGNSNYYVSASGVLVLSSTIFLEDKVRLQ
jgi:hypothetical protein